MGMELNYLQIQGYELVIYMYMYRDVTAITASSEKLIIKEVKRLVRTISYSRVSVVLPHPSALQDNEHTYMYTLHVHTPYMYIHPTCTYTLHVHAYCVTLEYKLDHVNPISKNAEKSANHGPRSQ